MAEFPPITHVAFVARGCRCGFESYKGSMMELAVVGAGVGRTGTHSIKSSRWSSCWARRAIACSRFSETRPRFRLTDRCDRGAAR